VHVEHECEWRYTSELVSEFVYYVHVEHEHQCDIALHMYVYVRVTSLHGIHNNWCITCMSSISDMTLHMYVRVTSLHGIHKHWCIIYMSSVDDIVHVCACRNVASLHVFIRIGVLCECRAWSTYPTHMSHHYIKQMNRCICACRITTFALCACNKWIGAIIHVASHHYIHMHTGA
jgi:hypothetical protein